MAGVLPDPDQASMPDRMPTWLCREAAMGVQLQLMYGRRSDLAGTADVVRAGSSWITTGMPSADQGTWMAHRGDASPWVDRG